MKFTTDTFNGIIVPILLNYENQAFKKFKYEKSVRKWY